MPTPTREEILAVYAAGPEAVVMLVQQLCAAHERQIAALTARVEALEAQLNKDSHNSHKPPSSDGLKKKRPTPKSLRRRSGKRPGGQPGHEGTTRQIVAHPDHRVEHSPTHCQQCGQSLEAAPPVYVERRQVVELPPQHLEVTEHRVEHKVCPHCTATTAAPFPAGVTQPVQYGPRFRAHCEYLRDYQLLPVGRTQEFFFDWYGERVSSGTLELCQHYAATQLQPIEAALKAAIIGAAVAHFDESGMRVAGRGRWLHVASTARLTYYSYQAGRAGPSILAVGILPVFKGTAVHDALPGYMVRDFDCQHGLCNAHLLRELIALLEDTGQRWTQHLIDLLLRIKAEVDQARAAGQTQLSPARQAAFVSSYQRLVARGLRLNPAAPPSGRRGRTEQSPARNLLERLRDHRSAILAFMYNFDVPFDNNLAERDLRMIKVRLKVSGCFRSPAAAANFCRIRGYISTLRKQGVAILDALLQLFAGQPLMPQLQP